LNKSKVLKVSVGEGEITASKYLTCYKQRNDRKMSGQRNVRRFWNDDDQPDCESDDEEYSIGDFIQTCTYGVLEILQLRKGNKYVHKAKVSESLQCIAVPYKWNGDRIYFAEPSFIMKNYFALQELLKTKVKCVRTWKERYAKYIEIDQDVPENVVPDHNIFTEPSKVERYCFCRVPDTDGGSYIECSNKNCKLQWYHFSCVKLKQAKPSKRKWTCPRCKKKF